MLATDSTNFVRTLNQSVISEKMNKNKELGEILP